MEPLAMVGRAEELGELTRAWQHLQDGCQGGIDVSGPRVAVITGPAGIGKSRLVSTALRGRTPVHVGAARLHSPAPYDWLAAVLSRRAPGTDEQLEISVPADALGWLRQDADVPRERFAPDALLRIAVRVVRALVGAGPAVLVVEDLHALDPASLNLIAALATAPLPALLVVTSRQPEVPLVADVLARLAGTADAIRQHLPPLDRNAVAAALAAAHRGGNPAVADAVWRRTGGNPFALTELLATTASADALRQEMLAPNPPALIAPTPSPRPSGTAATVPTQRPAEPTGDLTARERDVLACLADGMSNQQVAAHLGISIRTVTVHVSNLLRKTQCRSRTDAALWAVRTGAAAL
jgi:DNA-binding NarL/FixJ family response regulator